MWHYYKEPLVSFIELSRDALHVHFGLAIFFSVWLILIGRRNALMYAWMVVFCAQTVNELLDFHDWYVWVQAWNWKKSLADYVHTMLWPSVAVGCMWVEKINREDRDNIL